MARQNDIRRPIILTLTRNGAVWDVSSGTPIDIRGLKPSGASFTGTAAYGSTDYDSTYTGPGDGSDGVIAVFTSSSNFDEEGDYFFDARVQDALGADLASDTIHQYIPRRVA